MKSFKSYLNASVAEDRNMFHIIVIGDAANIEIVEEGVWTESGIMDYWKGRRNRMKIMAPCISTLPGKSTSTQK